MNLINKKIEYLFVIVIIALFVVLANKYILRNFDISKVTKNTVAFIKSSKPEPKVVCKEGQIKITVEGGDLCRDNVQYNGSESDIYLKIYDTYPKYGNGKEIVYSFLDEGDIETADNYLNNNIDVERYEPVKIEKINWEEDPYGETYWKFIFYSLRETRHLLHAYKTTGDYKYIGKLTETIESFVDDGMGNKIAWDDNHAVAFRGMVLTNTWWKLREENLLSVELSEKILRAIKRHGDFMMDENHYEGGNNHGMNQATSLLLLGVNFPEIDEGGKWRSMGEKRLNDGFVSLIDDDGVLIENSPYYHFYVLEKYWGLGQYFAKNNISISAEYSEKIDKMIAYAVNILKPNLNIPLLGASLNRQVGNSNAIKEIAAAYPEFSYVITQGRSGKEPADLNKYYPNTGQTIMRSGWEGKTKNRNKFEEQTQIIFDVGPYRTDHSDLDALSFDLYSNGKTLITDTGLYTYDENDKLKSYFHGTRGHNTVMVDGKDQRFGTPIPGKFQEGDGYVYYLAQHDLYPQTYHQRGMMLVGHDLIVIVDRIISNKEHDYEQLFHLAPGLIAENDGSSVVVRNEENKKEMVIRQVLANGLETNLGDLKNDPNNNLCSYEYKKTVPCQTVSFKKHSQNAVLVTLIEIGDVKDKPVAKELNEEKIIIESGDSSYLVNLNKNDNDFFDKINSRDEKINSQSFELFKNGDGWQLSGSSSDDFEINSDENGKIVLSPKNLNESLEYIEKPTYKAMVDGVKEYYSINQSLHLDIPWETSEKNFKIYEQEDFLPILGYHNVIPNDQEIKSPALEMHVSDFEKQISYMTTAMGCRWFTFADLMENFVLKEEKTPERACVINFDDGRENHFTNAYPVLKKYGAVSTFYIIAKYSIDNKKSYMGLAELDELYKNGNEIGSHTFNASSLLTDGYDEKGLVYQLEESKRILNEQGYNVKTFAYPRGEQNKEIVNLTSKYYIAGRDTSKDNMWREGRALTASIDESYIWHMNYQKPELNSLDELSKVIGYDSYWQFEEGGKTEFDTDGDVRTLSSLIPTANSYAVVNLPDIGDRVSNKFIISQDGDYTMEIFLTVNKDGEYKFAKGGAVNVFIDGVEGTIRPEMADECLIYKKQYYCFYNIDKHLVRGAHTISVEANLNNIKIDKFKVYKEKEVKDKYIVKLDTYKNVVPAPYPDEFSIDVKRDKSVVFFVFIMSFVVGSISLLSYATFRNWKKNKS